MKIWNDDGAQLHGRQGQVQHGVDVFGRKNGTGTYQGIQCKGKDASIGASVTETELRNEVEKAKRFKPPLSKFILATTAQNDAKIQEVARKITVEHEKKGLFSVEVLGWSEIQQRLSGFLEVIDAFYPDMGPTSQSTLKTTQIIEEKIDSEREAAERRHHEVLDVMTSAVNSVPVPDQRSPEIADSAFNNEVDRYKELLAEHKPQAALNCLEKLKERRWGELSNWLKFRVLTNIGAAQLMLGRNKVAARNFQEAFKYAPEEKIAMCNHAMSYLILGDYEKARKATETAAAEHPYYDHAQALVISTNVANPEVDNPSTLVPSDMLETTEVTYAIGSFFQKREDYSKAKEWMQKAYSLDDSSIEIRTGYAEAVLSFLSENQAIAFGGQLSNEQREELQKAIRILEQCWDEVNSTEAAPRYSYCAANICNGYRLLDEPEKGKRTVDEALVADPDSLILKRHKALMALLSGNWQEVLDAVDSDLEEYSADTQLMAVEALKGIGCFREANEKLQALLQRQLDSKLLIQAKLVSVQIEKEINGIEMAVSAAQKLADEWTDSVAVQMLSFDLALEKGDREEAEKWLNRVRLLINDDSSYVDRLIVAAGLFDLGHFGEAAQAYSPLITEQNDSKPLRRYLASLVESDQRKKALELLTELPEEVRTKDYYCRLATKLYEMIGDLPSAIRIFDKYFQSHPNDLQMRLLWIDALERVGGYESAIEGFLDSYTTSGNENPIDLINLSRALARHGRIVPSLKLAYETRRQHFSVPECHLVYIGLLLWSRNIPEWINKAEEVALDTAFTVEDRLGQRSTFIIEGSLQPDPSKNEWGPNHPIAKRALGKQVGDSIDFSTSKYSNDERRIVDIRHKYIFALHQSMAKFNEVFPEDNRLGRIQVTTDESSIEPIAQAVADRDEHIKGIIDYYLNQNFPIAIIAKLAGSHPIDVWSGLVAEPDIPVRCCLGVLHEREAAFEVIKTHSHGFLIDPVTLYAVHIFELGEVITSVVGKMSVTQSALDLIRALIEERKTHSTGYMTLLKQGDELVRQEISAEAVNENIKSLEGMLGWVAAHCEVVTAIGGETVPEEWGKVSGVFPRAFNDTLLAALGHNKALISDDMGLRSLAASIGVRGLWVQPILMHARAHNLLDADRYNQIILNYVRVNYQFISIDADVLFGIAHKDDWLPSDDFKLIAKTLGQENSDLKSSLTVSLLFLALYWQAPKPIEQKRSFTYAILNALNFSSYRDAKLIASVLIQCADKIGGRIRVEFVRAINDWLKGHFLYD